MENKVIGTMPCGCKVVRAPDKTMNPWVEYCPKHKAAPSMYEALKALIEHMTMPKGAFGRPYLADVRRMADKALSKAERRTP